MGVGAHAPTALRRERRKLRHQPATVVEELLWPVALHPTLEVGNVRHVLGIDDERHLVRSKGSFDLQAVDHLRPGPALGGSQHDHRPAGPNGVVCAARVASNLANAVDDAVHRVGHQAMHLARVLALDEVRRPAAAPQKLFELLSLDASEKGRVADLVAVEVEDGQNGPVRRGIEKLVRLPCGGQGSSLRFTVAYDARNHELGIVKRGSEGVAQRVSKLTTLMNRPGGRRRNVTGNATRK
jgi:hypothetical protein